MNSLVSSVERLDQILDEQQRRPRFGKHGWLDTLAHVPAEGLILEFGVFQGRSLQEIADIVSPRIIYGFDWFYGLPEDWVPGIWKKGLFNRDGRLPDVIPSNAVIVKGLVEKTIDPFLAEHPEPIVFCNFDLDLYGPTMYVLMAIKDRIADGCVFHFDEIAGECNNPHEHKAFADFLEVTGYDFELLGIGRHDTQQFKFRIRK